MDPVAEKLRQAPVGLDDYTHYLEDVVRGVEELDDEATVFTEAFRFMERNSHAHLGMPGPLVHFLERFYPRYIEALKASVLRVPTMHTLWMLNRMLNSRLEGEARDSLKAALGAVSMNLSIEPAIREQAEYFLHLHSTGSSLSS
jgi:hypothetical protein